MLINIRLGLLGLFCIILSENFVEVKSLQGRIQDFCQGRVPSGELMLEC